MNFLNNLFTTFADEIEEGCVDTAIFGRVCDSCNGSGIMQVLAYLVRILTYGIGILAVIGIMVFGIQILTSGSDQDRATKSRRHLFEVLIGVGSYIVIISALGWLLPGNLTTTMLGGDAGSCPTKTESEIKTIKDDKEVETSSSGSSPSTSSDPSDPKSDTTSADDDAGSDVKTNKYGWKIGKRPRECGPGNPGKPGELVNNAISLDNKGKFPLYTNSVGRTFVHYSQSGGDWGSMQMLYSKNHTMATAGCTATCHAMMGESFISKGNVFPNPKWGNEIPAGGNLEKVGQGGCNNKADCDKLANKIKTIIKGDNKEVGGGVIMVHACGRWGGQWKVCNYRSSHYFLLVDYREKNGKAEYFSLNTSYGEKWYGGKRGTGWGTFDFKDTVEDYTLYYYKPKNKKLDCKVSSK